MKKACLTFCFLCSIVVNLYAQNSYPDSGVIVSSFANSSIGGGISLNNPAKNDAGAAKSWKILNMSGSYGNSLQFWAYDSLGCAGGLCQARLVLLDNGYVGIGTRSPRSQLSVAGTITTQRIKVTMTGWSDYVFNRDYRLPSLEELEQLIRLHKHLPGIPSADDIVNDGLDLGSMQQKQMEKIEELTLYLIAQNKKLAAQEALLAAQDKRLNALEEKLSYVNARSGHTEAP
jgi:hypothetical protein